MKKIIALTIICTAALLGFGKKDTEPAPAPVTATETSASIEDIYLVDDGVRILLD